MEISDKTDKKVSLNLERLMKERDLNQRQLALKSNIAPEYLNKILRGKKSLGIDVANKLAAGLNCSVDEIFTGIKPEAKATPTVESLLRALTEMQSELSKLTQAKSDDFKASPLFDLWTKSDEVQRRELSDLAKAYVDASAPERRAAFQMLHPTFGDELELPDLEEKQSHAHSKKTSR